MPTRVLHKKRREKCLYEKYEAACEKTPGSWKQLGAVATISGVGFWDKPYTQNPHGPNFAELHPVTTIKFISGCGA